MLRTRQTARNFFAQSTGGHQPKYGLRLPEIQLDRAAGRIPRGGAPGVSYCHLMPGLMPTWHSCPMPSLLRPLVLPCLASLQLMLLIIISLIVLTHVLEAQGSDIAASEPTCMWRQNVANCLVSVSRFWEQCLCAVKGLAALHQCV